MDTLIAMKCDFSFIYEILNLLHVRSFNNEFIVRNLKRRYEKEKVDLHIKYLDGQGLINVLFAGGTKEKNRASDFESAAIYLTPVGHQVRQAMASAELVIKRE